MTISHDINIERLSVEHSLNGLAVGTSSPRLSWRFSGSRKDWIQQSYSVRIVGPKRSAEEYEVETAASVLVSWPSPIPLQSREKVTVAVQARGQDGSTTGWSSLTFEAGILDASEWQDTRMISCLASAGKRPFLLKRRFHLHATGDARLYVTAHGIYEMEINGKRVGDHVLAPGWTPYQHRLAYQTFDVSHVLVPGENVITAYIGLGWFNGRLGFLGGKSDIFGRRNGLFARLMVNDETVIATDETWQWSPSPITASELYDGEHYDARLLNQPFQSWSVNCIEQDRWQSVDIIESPKASLVSDQSMIKRMETVSAAAITRSPSGKVLVDFGQNLVGWIRLNSSPAGAYGSTLTLTHAEVLEHGELGTRPLRIAKCQDNILLGDQDLTGWEPKFTYHGFRYVQVDGWDGAELKLGDLTAVVIHTEMERLGEFHSSHAMVNQLHQNVVWGLKGNFVGIPTDCPQRDERLGWTGDLQVFARTASFLYGTSNMLGSWLQDVAAEQLTDNDGVPSLFTPNWQRAEQAPDPFAVWGDVTVLTPFDLYEGYGDCGVLETQFESLVAWLDRGIKRGPNGLWDEDSFQLGDWLSPDAHPDHPGDCRTDPQLVANAYLLHSTNRASQISLALGHQKQALKYRDEYVRLRETFINHFVSPDGRPISDSQTAIALVLHFDLLRHQQRPTAIKRLNYLVRKNIFKVGTGFAGTPIILDVLAANGQLSLAYRMLQEKQCPSWLYCVSQGATTIWERWDSMMEDGSINPGEMTSFNHYALGAVANFMHSTIGGISPLEPGWKHVLIRPQPGGTITSASVSHKSPYGQIKCSWMLKDEQLVVDIAVPPNSSATVELPGLKTRVGSGKRQFAVCWKKDVAWPPKPIYHSLTVPLIDEIA